MCLEIQFNLNYLSVETVQWLLFYVGKTITSKTNLLHNAEVIYNKVWNESVLLSVGPIENDCWIICFSIKCKIFWIIMLLEVYLFNSHAGKYIYHIGLH